MSALKGIETTLNRAGENRRASEQRAANRQMIENKRYVSVAPIDGQLAEIFRELKLWVFRKANIMPQGLLLQRVARIFLRNDSRKPATPDFMQRYLC